jgi:hypothetical protein
LISPEVTPFIRDEPELFRFLNRRGADYLIAFPDFYPLLIKNARIAFVTNGAIAPTFDQENMVIYLWEIP